MKRNGDADCGPEGRRAEIVAGARAIIEQDGPPALTMRAIADRLGIRAPSLYKHFQDKEAIEVELVAVGLGEWAEALALAVDGSLEPLADLGRAYRAWALGHPHLYRLMNDKPLPREHLPAGLEARAARPVIDATGSDPDLARAAWGLAHGLTSLELAGRFPPDADISAAWDAATAAFQQALVARGVFREEGA
jgi:AcrR family transcriptional regulator